ncbi:hypothetical protein ACFYNW_37655 [Streptomyces virginiae]|uniref:hypothetical protein n=1 Tax=Streptomyces virginiae TaxID=1961 RepID=UPI0036EA0DBE
MENEQAGTASRGLTRDEVEQLNTLLGRFCTYDLDQFELIRTQAPYGEAYIVISNKPIADTVPEQYHTI